jgi:hypothetical protein
VFRADRQADECSDLIDAFSRIYLICHPDS